MNSYSRNVPASQGRAGYALMAATDGAFALATPPTVEQAMADRTLALAPPAAPPTLAVPKISKELPQSDTRKAIRAAGTTTPLQTERLLDASVKDALPAREIAKARLHHTAAAEALTREHAGTRSVPACDARGSAGVISLALPCLA